MIGFLLLGLGAVVVAGLIVWLAAQHHRRVQALESLAAEWGWDYTSKDRHLHRRFAGMQPFRMGGSPRSLTILSDPQKERLVFQFEYTTSNGKSSQTHPFRCAATRMPLDGPDLLVCREHLGHKIMDALGGEDIDFESHEFSRRFWVRCKDRRFAYDILTPGLQEWLLERPGIHWQWHGRTLLIHEPGVLSAPDARRLLAELDGFVERLPRHRLAEAST